MSWCGTISESAFFEEVFYKILIECHGVVRSVKVPFSKKYFTRL